MNKKNLKFSALLLCGMSDLLFYCICITLTACCSDIFGTTLSYKVDNEIKTYTIRPNPDLKQISTRLHYLINTGNKEAIYNIIDTIRFVLENSSSPDNPDLADACYYSGSFYLKSGNAGEAFSFLKKSSDIFERTGNKSNINYSNCLYNIGLTYLIMGDFIKSMQYMQSSSDNDVKIFGENSVKLVEGYLGLSINSIYTRNFDKAIDWINKAIKIAQLFPDSVKPFIAASLYSTKGTAYSFQSNYDQAKINLEKAETYYSDLKQNDLNYINLLDNLGTAYHYLGFKEKSYHYYEKGLTLLKNDLSYPSFNLTNNYAIILGNDQEARKGEHLMYDFLKRVEKTPGYDKRNYYLILRNYADYLREKRLDNHLAIKIYLQCISYVNTHLWDKDYRDKTILGYSLSLLQDGEYQVALDSIQTLLFSDPSGEKKHDRFANPEPGSFKTDVRTILIFNAKFQILFSEYRKTDNLKALEAAAETSELIISVLEKIRFNIGEEGSRLLLGDKYREFYINAINCFNECFKKSKNQTYLDKIFEYSEKSKVASLLASTREMKAIQTHIPLDLANSERDLQRNIGFYNARIAEEENLENPDQVKIGLWKDFIISATGKRDSLLKVFEKNYPAYYSLKYNTRVISLKEIPGLIGNNNNYISYILSDTLLYTLVSNKKNHLLLTQRIDSSFFNLVAQFRRLLIFPDLDERSKAEFHDYQVYGHKLYSYLVKPLGKYLISKKLIISPDNILSYIPFETFITSDDIHDDLIFRNLSYLMNDFRISYAYSATLLSESEKAKTSLWNSLIAFAPSYILPVNVDINSNDRQSEGGSLYPLPFAVKEAEYVTGITHGKLYSDTSATKLIYKNLAGSFDIVHLAMHTMINNLNPILSKMIFSVSKDSLDKFGLNIFEIYGIPLNAKMVVLSSCNTGSGNLLRGEGVLSLARGFIYSGSKSVVLSLWEVNDISGTEVVKSFYSNLKNGDSKSESLGKARIKYLKSATQLNSHPYFWSTLVIYGDDSPLYSSIIMRITIAIAIISVLLIISAIYYFKKR
jgi:CHAT domain-containing protein